MQTESNNKTHGAVQPEKCECELCNAHGQGACNPVTHNDRQYYYRPLAFDNGKTMKCAGFGGEQPEHRKFYMQWFDEPLRNGDTAFLKGVVLMQGYHGDRITSDYADDFKIKL